MTVDNLVGCRQDAEPYRRLPRDSHVRVTYTETPIDLCQQNQHHEHSSPIPCRYRRQRVAIHAMNRYAVLDRPAPAKLSKKVDKNPTFVIRATDTRLLPKNGCQSKSDGTEKTWAGQICHAYVIQPVVLIHLGRNAPGQLRASQRQRRRLDPAWTCISPSSRMGPLTLPYSRHRSLRRSFWNS